MYLVSGLVASLMYRYILAIPLGPWCIDIFWMSKYWCINHLNVWFYWNDFTCYDINFCHWRRSHKMEMYWCTQYNAKLWFKFLILPRECPVSYCCWLQFSDYYLYINLASYSRKPCFHIFRRRSPELSLVSRLLKNYFVISKTHLTFWSLLMPECRHGIIESDI